jgi:hypothetical protein
VSTYRTTYFPNDATGCYWVLKGRAGHHLATTYATLPSIENYNAMDVPYMMYGVKSTGGMNGDYGVYFSSKDSKWHGFWSTNYNKNGTNISDGGWSGDKYDPSPIPQNQKIYMYCWITSNGYVRIRVVNGNDFNQVYYDISAYQYNSTTATNADIYKQITLAQKSSQNHGITNTSTGTRMLHACYNQSYLYSDTKTWKWNPENVWDAYRASQTMEKAKTVTVNSYTPWSDEDISIRMNQ